MDNPKALQTFIDLEVARCNERWTDIPELARRYKKYHPYESVLEFTARMEAEFILLVRQIRQEIVATDSNVTDLPSSASSPASPATTSPPTTPAPTTRKWGNRQIINTIGSSSNLSNSSTAVGTTSIVKRNYPEESDVFYQLDDPSSISLAPRLLPSQVQLILVRLLDVIQRQIKSGELETPDDWQAQFSKIILARIYYETGRYDKALEWLQHLALRLEDVEAGYGLVLLVQARVIKGVCFENQENYTEALDCYLGALKVAEQHPNEQNKSLSFWLEECLYRSVLLQLRKKGPVKQTLKLMRTYLHYCCTQWPSDWRIHKRWIVFRHYIRYLTRAYQKGVYVPAAPEDEYTSPASPVLSPSRSVFSETGDTTLFERSVAALDETIQLMTQFRSLLTVFANAYHKKNPIDLSHRALELSNLMFAAHDTVGWGSADYMRRTLRYLYRMRKFTFNSLCTTRHIFYTLLKLGEVQEAKLALLEYLELLNVPHVLDRDQSALTLAEQQQNMDSSDDEDEDAYLENIAETIQNRLDHIVHQSLSSTNKNLLFWEDKLKLLQGARDSDEEEEEEFYSSDDSSPPPAPQRMPQKKAPIGSYESDMEFDVVKLIIAASHQLYGQHYKQGQEASALSDIAVALMEESEHLKKKKASQWRLLMVQSRRVRGASYGLYAMQCHDEKKRSIYMAESIASLKRASELDSRSWQTFYELGLQQALMGDMVSAASSAKRSIKLRGDFIPSWHLLSLVQSSRQFHALPKSLQLIQAALGYHMNMIENFDNEEDPDLILTLDTEEGQDFFDRAEAYMKLRMSQLCFLEILEGAEAAIKVYPNIFDMYAKLSQKMSLAVSVTDIAEKPTHSRKPSASSHSQRQDGSNSVRSRANSRTNISSVISFNSLLDSNEDKESLNSSNFALPSPQQLLHDDEVSLDGDQSSSKLHEDSEFMRSSTLLKVEEEDSAEQCMEDEERVITEEKKSGRKHRKSINLSRQFMDDPLLSFPTASKPKKDKKEKREPKTPKKLLSTKSLFRSSSPMTAPKTSSLNSTPTDDNRKDVEDDVSKLSEAISSSFTSNNSSSIKGTSIRPSLSNQNNSSYFSTLQQHMSNSNQESSMQLPVKSSLIAKDAYFARREKQWQCILIKIWIMASATYTRAHRFDEAFKAIAEADQLTHGLDADVWHQIGIIAVTASNSGKKSAQQQDRALDAFKRALSIDPHHVATHTALASMYVGLDQFELAEQLLEKTTKGLGWNQTEAWYLLSKVYTHHESLLDAKNSLIYALKLSDTSPIESLDVLPRFV
ncbi:hypothetical protein MAM1_0124c05948 [Mucor ambiguus]|uniref:TPR-like protein n=1 Tax=Mucor ambiguus TaxID=91626 RepID=A0A0C9MGN2_9FUNG|nr:hypothetical protein MAM1_0124c05948 [Mucor ambiguus]